MRLSKFIAQAGLSSRRGAEELIDQGRVTLNGAVVNTQGVQVRDNDKVCVDGKPVGAKPAAKVWLFHKPKGQMTTHHDPQGRPTVFEHLADVHKLTGVISVGRLDLNSEGLLLITNDRDFAYKAQQPGNSWLRTYHVRVFGEIDPKMFTLLQKGITIEGIRYRPIHARVLEYGKGRNHWLEISLEEGKNREIRKVMEHFYLQVNRLIRVAYGPYKLGELTVGAVALTEKLTP